MSVPARMTVSGPVAGFVDWADAIPAVSETESKSAKRIEANRVMEDANRVTKAP
jgi:hypothetical protein